MPAPFKPREFQALVIQEDDSVCTAIKNLLQLSVMWWEMVAYKYKPTADGFTTEYAALINAALDACPEDAVEFGGIVPNPQDFKNFLLSPTSIFCEKFVKLAMGVSQKLYEWVAFEWNDEATDFTDEFKALLCGLDCNEPEAIDIQSLLNYREFDKWDVVDGEVDLVGIAPWLTEIENPDGMYVDLHGTYYLDGARSGPGVMRMKTDFAVEIEAGKEYSITFRHAGHGIPNALLGVEGTVIATLRKVSDLSQYESVTNTWTAAAWNSDFTTRTLAFTAGTTAECIFELKGDPDIATWAGRDVGPKIDTVRIRNVTDDTTLFFDDFDIEEQRSGAVDCGTPDPDDSMDAIPTSDMEVCEKLSKLLQDFPQNLYDVASFEFAPSGSGFSKCFKAWLCNPEGVLDNGLLNNLLAHWPHDEASGPVLDEHTEGRDLTETDGTLASTAGALETARVYGTGETARAANAAWNDLSATDWTFAAWLKLTVLPAVGSEKQYLVSKGQLDGVNTSYGIFLEQSSTGNLRIAAVINSLAWYTDAFPAPATDSFIFVCVRFRTADTMITIDYGVGGVLSDNPEANTFAPPVVSTDEFILGGGDLSGSPESTLNGNSLDEVALWDRELTDEQVSTLYNYGTPLPYEDFT